MSARRVGWVGCQFRESRVIWLEAGQSRPAIMLNQPKWLGASSGEMEAVGRFRRVPMSSAIWRKGTASSPTAW